MDRRGLERNAASVISMRSSVKVSKGVGLLPKAALVLWLLAPFFEKPCVQVGGRITAAEQNQT